MDTNDYKTLIIHLKSAILQSRFDAARLANKELLGLHFQIGKLIAHRVQQSGWGAKTSGFFNGQSQEDACFL
jgi:hypothetical protein